LDNLDNVKIGSDDELPKIASIEADEVVEQPSGIDLSGITSLLKTPTGPGEIADYVGHPLNFDGSAGMAQVLRGLTGIFDNLALAVVDIAIGVVRWKRGKVAADGAGVGA
jgi:hypothetical protein